MRRISHSGQLVAASIFGLTLSYHAVAGDGGSSIGEFDPLARGYVPLVGTPFDSLAELELSPFEVVFEAPQLTGSIGAIEVTGDPKPGILSVGGAPGSVQLFFSPLDTLAPVAIAQVSVSPAEGMALVPAVGYFLTDGKELFALSVDGSTSPFGLFSNNGAPVENIASLAVDLSASVLGDLLAISLDGTIFRVEAGAALTTIATLGEVATVGDIRGADWFDGQLLLSTGDGRILNVVGYPPAPGGPPPVLSFEVVGVAGSSPIEALVVPEPEPLYAALAALATLACIARRRSAGRVA